mgnify:CR=1 FL=1
MSLWLRICEALEPKARHRSRAQQLADEWFRTGYVHETPSMMLQEDDAVIACFLRLIEEAKGRPRFSENKPDSTWMRQASYSFVNIRATGAGEQYGNILTALKVIAATRCTAIHLAPFLLYDFQVIYAVSSLRTIAPEILHPRLSDSGILPAEQLLALIQGIHILGKAAGFDLEPHTAQFSMPAFMCPEAFRWIKLDPDNKAQIAGGRNYHITLNSENQAEIRNEVRELVLSTLSAHGLTDLEAEFTDTLEVQRCKLTAFNHLIKESIARGYWTIPCQVWCGHGVPEFTGYHAEKHYPLFRYLDPDGNDRTREAFHILTPFAFYDGYRPNSKPEKHELEVNDAGIRLFTETFLYFRDTFGFDFIRFDSADHIFDSYDPELHIPQSDRPSPEVLAKCITVARSGGHPGIGAFAERMGNEIELYRESGFDVILGDDMFDSVNGAHFNKTFSLIQRIAEMNRTGEFQSSIAYTVDTHDTGNPFIRGNSIIASEDCNTLTVRHVISRFASCGLGIRPKYEVMGFQDKSHGLYEANIRNHNLKWNNYREQLQRYHFTENVFELYAAFLEKAELNDWYVNDHFAWWMPEDAGGSLTGLILYPAKQGIEIRNFVLPVKKVSGRAKLYDCNAMAATEIVINNSTVTIDTVRSGEILIISAF